MDNNDACTVSRKVHHNELVEFIMYPMGSFLCSYKLVDVDENLQEHMHLKKSDKLGTKACFFFNILFIKIFKSHQVRDKETMTNK